MRGPHPDARAVAALRAGRPVLVTGPRYVTVALAAATVLPTTLAWTVRHTCGLVRVALPPEHAGRLRLARMAGTDLPQRGMLQTVSVDARVGVGTGISASDRCRTLRVLADPASGPGDLAAPGHVLVELLGTAHRPDDHGDTVARTAADLCRAAGLAVVVALAEAVDAAGELVGPAGAAALAARTGLPAVSCSVPDRACSDRACSDRVRPAG